MRAAHLCGENTVVFPKVPQPREADGLDEKEVSAGNSRADPKVKRVGSPHVTKSRSSQERPGHSVARLRFLGLAWRLNDPG